MELDIQACIEDINEDFYKENIENSFNIKLLSSNENNKKWRVDYQDNDPDVTIYAGEDFPNIGSFTHEILHLYLFDNDFELFPSSTLQFYSKLYRKIVETKETVDGILNAIAHYKMLPLFTDRLGFRKIDFFPNGERVVTDADIERLKEKYKIDSTYDNYPFTNFIRTFFDTRYHFSSDLESEYGQYIEELKSIDGGLYNILDNNCLTWEKSKSYNNTDFFNSLYKQLNDYL